MNIFWFETKKKLLSTVIWVAGIAVFLLIFYSVYGTMSSGVMDDILKQFPEAFLKAFGMHEDMSTVLGYTAMVGVYIALFGAIFSSNLGLNAVHVEEQDMTADFLVPKPVSRNKIMVSKIAAALVHMTAFALLNALCCLWGIAMFASGVEYSQKIFWLMMLGVYILQLLFFTMGLFISVALKKLGSPTAFSMGLSFGFFILNSFDTILNDTPIRFFVPYDYFEFQYVIDNAAFKTYGLIISLSATVILTTASFLLYNRRNIATAM
jgi:ABC-2 type transport system permease protein